MSEIGSDGSNTLSMNIEQTQTSFLNIEWTWKWSSIGDRKRTPYFWLQTTEQRTLNLIGLSLDLLNYLSNRLEHHFSNIERTWTCSSIGDRIQTPNFWLRTLLNIEHSLTQLIEIGFKKWIILIWVTVLCQNIINLTQH